MESPLSKHRKPSNEQTAVGERLDDCGDRNQTTVK